MMGQPLRVPVVTAVFELPIVGTGTILREKGSGGVGFFVYVCILFWAGELAAASLGLRNRIRVYSTRYV